MQNLSFVIACGWPGRLTPLIAACPPARPACLLQLNQPEVVDAITRHLRSDPAFAALLEHSNSVGPPARWLTIEELQEEPEAEAEAEGAQLWPVPGGRAGGQCWAKGAPAVQRRMLVPSACC